MNPSAVDDADELAGSSVFRKPPGRVWAVSFAAHAAVFAALGVVGTFIGVKTGFIPPTIIELEAPPPPRRPLPPPVAPPPRPAAPEAAAPRAPRPASRPANHAARPGRAAAPHVLAAHGNGSGNGDEMPVGENNDFQGGLVGNGGDGAVEAPRPAPEPEPEASVHAGTGRRGPVQIPEEAVPPVAVERPMPAYPEGARRSGVQAEVVARVVIDEDGSVSAVEILRGHPDFDALVRDVLRRWRFQPATVDGHALAVYQIVRVPFRLENL